MYKSNYDKYPSTIVEGTLWKGWEDICSELRSNIKNGSRVVVIECYQGVHHEELFNGFQELKAAKWIDTKNLFKSVNEIEQMTYPYVTDDSLFGFRANFSMLDFMDAGKLVEAQEQIAVSDELTVVYGHGAALVVPNPDLLVYVDMARWEIQKRARRHEINGLGVENKDEGASLHYKRGYFVDWIVCDKLKK